MVTFRSFAAILAVVCGLITHAPAADATEIKAGVVRQDFSSLWAAGPEFERGWGLNGEIEFDPVVDLIGLDLSPYVGGTLTPGSEVDKVYAGLGLELGAGPMFFRLGLGAALHNGDTEDPDDFFSRRQFGSQVLFHIPVEAGVGIVPGVRVSLYFDHMSNAGLADYNPGMDTLGLRIGLGF
ncbi:MAG TPA: acyloxyacyl hydrolase [Azospirillaceae bacterium]|nr:acyloxyacyl hydrolase [Azospirillaceae bacterium]